MEPGGVALRLERQLLRYAGPPVAPQPPVFLPAEPPVALPPAPAPAPPLPLSALPGFSSLLHAVTTPPTIASTTSAVVSPFAVFEIFTARLLPCTPSNACAIPISADPEGEIYAGPTRRLRSGDAGTLAGTDAMAPLSCIRLYESEADSMGCPACPTERLDEVHETSATGVSEARNSTMRVVG